jgi:hypothetical protein
VSAAAQRPGQRNSDQLAHRVGNWKKDTPKSPEEPAPEGAVLLEHRSFQAVHLGQIGDDLIHRGRVQVDPRDLSSAIVRCTGSLGIRRGIKNTAVIPTKMTRKY